MREWVCMCVRERVSAWWSEGVVILTVWYEIWNVCRWSKAFGMIRSARSCDRRLARWWSPSTLLRREASSPLATTWKVHSCYWYWERVCVCVYVSEVKWVSACMCVCVCLFLGSHLHGALLCTMPIRREQRQILSRIWRCNQTFLGRKSIQWRWISCSEFRAMH